MATRDDIPGSPLSGPVFIADLNDKFGALFPAAVYDLTSVSGTDTVTATLTPALGGGGLATGMKFSILWQGANTGAVTLNINGGGAVPVLDREGVALNAGDLASNMLSIVGYQGSAFRILTPLSGASQFGRRVEIITASQSYTWPTDLPDDTPVFIEAIGGGGGGHNDNPGGGGGGGSYASGYFRLGDLRALGASMSMTIGAGGAAGSNGGNTTVGSILTAYGGQRGVNLNGGRGAGSNESGNAGGYLGGGAAGDGGDGGDATSPDGGGGGGASVGAGGRAVRGGAGGGGTTGGSSKLGGDGGDAASPGSAPGGGGGRQAAGGRGEVRIFI